MTIIPGLYGVDSATAWRALQKDPQKYVDRFAKDKTVQANISAFEKKAVKFDSVDDLMKDKKSLQYVLDTYGLGSEINNAGRIKKVLTQDPTDKNSLVNKLADTKFKAMATALRLDKGTDKLNSATFLDGMEKSYIRNEFEEALGDQDPALRQAAYFARTSNTISSVYSILGDKVMRDVVTTTLNLPREIAIQPVETQAKVVAARVNVSKFAGIAGTTNATAAQLTRAKSDHTLIETNLAVSDAALKQVKSVQSQIAQLATGYANLPTITDPNGINADTIALQKTAVPQLVGFQQSLTAANAAIDFTTSGLTKLSDLIDKAGVPGSDLSDLKNQFNALVNAISTKVYGATVTKPDGSTENILTGGVNATQTATYATDGGNVTMNTYDLRGLQDVFTSASQAFNAATGSGDTTNLTNAKSRILRTMETVGTINTQIDGDISNLNKKMDAAPFFAASLNNGQLLKGKQSIDDSLSRTAQVEGLLNKITTLAAQAKDMNDTDDHTDVNTQFNNYRTQVRALIENPGTGGLDNFMAGTTAQSYEIVDGKTVTASGGRDLKTSIADVLDGMDLSNKANAGVLEIKSIQLTTQTTGVTNGLNAAKPLFDRIVGTYDPRAKLDTQIYVLKTQVDTIVAGAAKNGSNLLSAGQTKIKLDSLSTGASLSFTPQTTFKTDLDTALGNVIGQLGNGVNAILDTLDDTADMLGRTQRALSGDNRMATMEYGKLGSTIDVLDPKNTAATSTTYKTNAFTEKFILRYLTTAGSDGSSSPSSYLGNLFGGSDTSTAMDSIFSLVGSLRV